MSQRVREKPDAKGGGGYPEDFPRAGTSKWLVGALVPAENRTEGLGSLRGRSADSGAAPKIRYRASRELHAPSRGPHPHPFVEVCDEASDCGLEAIFFRSNLSVEVSGEYTAIGDRRARLY